MEKLFKQEFQRDGRNYYIALSFDDEAIMEDGVKFDTTIKAQSEDGKWQEVSVIAEFDWKEKKLKLKAKVNSIEVDFSHEIHLDKFLPEMGDIMNLPDGDYFDGFLDGMLGDKISEATERIIRSIPTDPLFGCLVKGSLSTIIGQIIKCWPNIRAEYRGDYDWKTKVRRMCSMLKECFRKNSLKMLGTFTRRFLKCALFHGLA